MEHIQNKQIIQINNQTNTQPSELGNYGLRQFSKGPRCREKTERETNILIKTTLPIEAKELAMFRGYSHQIISVLQIKFHHPIAAFDETFHTIKTFHFKMIYARKALNRFKLRIELGTHLILRNRKQITNKAVSRILLCNTLNSTFR